MSGKEFLADKALGIFLKLLALCALGIFLMMGGTDKGVVLLIAIAWLLTMGVSLAIEYIRKNRHLKELYGILQQLGQKYLFAECLPKSQDNYERRIFDMLRRSGKSMIEEVSKIRNNQREYQEYIESWIHEIKTPITALNLCCKNSTSDTAPLMMPQINQIEAHVERALYYARLSSVEKDFLVRKCTLEDVADKAIQKMQSLLISQNIRIETEGLEQIVYTDNKWAEFMVGQILMNALRYRSDTPYIRITGSREQEKVCLAIQDNGIGIPCHELPRVFERGFTGSNGRSLGGTTGMGLYLCKKIAEALQIEIKAESKENEYMKILMIFPAPNLSEM